jgi:DNA topoisomerase-1
MTLCGAIGGWRSDKGEPGNVDSADVNQYLKEISQEDFTAKDFRTWCSADHVAQQLAALGPPLPLA